MAMSVGRPCRGAIADINVTPMADVMIVLLIIFMVATPVIVGAPVRLPPAFNAADQRQERLEVVVRASGAVTAGGLELSGSDTLAEWISARRATGAEAVVLVQATGAFPTEQSPACSPLAAGPAWPTSPSPRRGARAGRRRS